ncbi:unnamed protein product [Calicophoron daubneyi]|uniref:Uncharacterized protein n=1 Tax=Calicophoron daubneyi TaxID=300641 RepID=A0AAV2TPR9_CALDB
MCHCLFALSLLLSVAGISHGEHWTYLTFTQIWPISYCSFVPCGKIPEPVDFTVHGLWPDPFPKTEQCDPAPDFKEDILKPLKSLLNQHWPNLDVPGNPAFWEHEWNKHGKCAIENKLIANELQYFNVSLILREDLDLQNKLKAQGITPSDSIEYKKEDFLKALKAELGVLAEIACVLSKSGKPLLDEIRVCYNLALKVIDCDISANYGYEKPTIKCPETFLFPYSTQ